MSGDVTACAFYAYVFLCGFDATLETNGRCRSATTVKMSSFLFLLPHSLMPQTDGVERGDGENGGKRRIKEKGAPPGHISPGLPITDLYPAQPTSSCQDTAGRDVLRRPVLNKVFAVKLSGLFLLKIQRDFQGGIVGYFQHAKVSGQRYC